MRVAKGFPVCRVGLFAVALGAVACSGGQSGSSPELTAKSSQAVTVLPSINPAPTVNTFVVYASQSVTLGAGDHSLGGDIGVSTPSSASILTVGSNDGLDPLHNLYGYSVVLGKGAVVGDIETSSLTNGGGVFNAQAAFPSSMPPLPQTFSASPGTSNFTVAAGQQATLNPGTFGTLTDNGTVFLNPGTYSFSSVTLGNNAQLQAKQGGSTGVLIAGTLSTGTFAQIFPIGQPANVLTIAVSGTDGTGGQPTAVSIGANTQITSLLSASKGSLSFGNNAQATGAFAGVNFTAGSNVQLNFQSGFPIETPGISTFVAYAELSLTLGTGVQSVGGDFGVAAVGASTAGTQLTVGSGDVLDQTHTLYSPSISLGSSSLVGDVAANTLTNGGGRFGTDVPYPTSPMPLMPLPPAATPGTQNVTVATGQQTTLSPGNFGSVTDNGTLFLNPGAYCFSSVTLGNGAQLQALQGGSTSIVVAGTLSTGTLAQIFPAGQAAGNLSISVAGNDGANGSPLAASLGANTQITALLSVPRGTLSLANNVQATGAFAGFAVSVGNNAILNFQTGFSPTAPGQVGQQQLQGYAGLGAPLVGPVPGSTQVAVGFGLPGQNLAGLQAFAHQVSNPQGPQYRQYLTPSQLAATYGATPSDYQGLASFLQANGLTVVATYPNNLYVEATGPASALNAVLYTNLVYRKRADGTQFISIDRDPSVNLTTPLLHVSGLENVVTPQAAGPGGRGVPASDTCLNGAYPCSSLFFGPDLPTAYTLTARTGETCPSSNSGLNGSGQRMGLFWADPYNIDDVDDFASGMGITLGTNSITNFGPTPGSDGLYETTMDIEASLAMAPGLSAIYVFGGNTTAGAFSAMATTTPLAYQLSMSYIIDVDSNAQAALAVLASQGQSFFVASGDWGGSEPDANDIRVQDYVTVVGGTLLTMNPPGLSYDLENGWPSSGGGFPVGANLPAQPVYQSGISWTQNGGSPTTRNYPDVAMPAQNFAMYTGNGNTTYPNGYWNDGSGSSLATPLFAGYIALVNQANANNAVQSNEAPDTVGFANPLLYYIAESSAYGTAFNDIADGTTNPSTRSPSHAAYLAPDGGPLTFTAVTGYDLVTGWGSPTCNLIWQLDTYVCAPNSAYEYPCPVGTGSACQTGTHTCNGSGNFNGNACACPTVEWAYSYGQQGDMALNSVAVDSNGNVFLGGSYNNTNGAIPGLPTLPSSGSSGSGLLVWLDPEGAVINATALTGSGTVSVAGVAVDGNDNYYVVGASGGTVIAGTTTTSITAPSGGGTQGYVLQFSSSMSLGWALAISNGGGGNVTPAGIAVSDYLSESQALVAIGGSYTGTLTAGGTTVPGGSSTASGNHGFVAALNAQGAVSWVDDLSATSPPDTPLSNVPVETEVQGVGVDGLNTVYAYGATNSQNAFLINGSSTGSSVQNVLTNSSGATLGGTFFVRLGTFAGALVSFTPLGNDCTSVAAMAADPSAASSVIYLACGSYVPGGGGYHGGSAETVVQYSETSNVYSETWTEPATGQSPTGPGGISALTQTTDGSVAAAFQYILPPTYSGSSISLPSVPSNDTYLLGVAKFSATDGSPLWARAYDGQGAISALASGNAPANAISSATPVVVVAGSISASATVGWTLPDPQSQSLAVAAELIDP